MKKSRLALIVSAVLGVVWILTKNNPLYNGLALAVFAVALIVFFIFLTIEIVTRDSELYDNATSENKSSGHPPSHH